MYHVANALCTPDANSPEQPGFLDIDPSGTRAQAGAEPGLGPATTDGPGVGP